ncbi:hypothetical protein GGI20_004087 [Coemansia sp. BCRC 34301]|nr:hypothetical protein GGI20_004087 [Coemansia sp. BCRC 34301]
MDTHSLATMPGVGDAEVTAEECATLRAIGHHMFSNLATHTGFPETSPDDEPAIPATTGSYRIFSYSMPPAQQPYAVNDDEFSRKRLCALYTKDRTGQLQGLPHTMVVASSSAIKGAVLDDSPMYEGERIVFYVNGGGFITSDVPQLKWVYVRMSQELGLRVFVPRYRVAPQYVYPRSIHDVYTAYRHLESRGFLPQNILMMGASAGANICLSALQLLASPGTTPSGIAGCVVVAPCIDLTMSHGSWQQNQPSCVLPYVPFTDPGSIPRVYLGPNIDEDIADLLRRPLLSPLFADTACLPPIQVQVGENDVLYDEAKAFAARVPTAELITYPGINHYTLLRGRTQLDRFYGDLRRFADRVFK